MRAFLAALVAFSVAAHANAFEGSPGRLLGSAPSLEWLDERTMRVDALSTLRNDPRVIVRMPKSAETPWEIPVTVDARAIPDVERIVLSLDGTAAPRILTYYPGAAEARLSFRFEMATPTPVRASVRTQDGRWFIGGTTVDAGRGGADRKNTADEPVGTVRGRLWPESGRLRVIVRHPTEDAETPDAVGSRLEDLSLHGPDGRLARLELSEPVVRDPAFTFYFPPRSVSNPIRLVGRDSRGNAVEATIPAPLTQ
ncbi:MAG: thiosulfate oxidation carrier protein SoxY [Pseudomonadota bacterium]